ncbi:MAG: sugar transferase [Oscillospiraceae bacterium]|jgi:lipopolysaccharide/colanic/teichoic acid biosynthesis glycosyltransferase|nr:sugar transferase [Oscillospiraceae bacterium]
MYRIIKRGLDMLLATILLALCWPVMAIVALLIRAENGGRVFFVQERPGLHGKLFRCRKFRTMRPAHHEDEPDMLRIGSLGKRLRRLSLDELPQLLNILRGEMSFIGPRPLLPEYLSCYTAEQMRRHDVRPGLTGWAQVNGRNTVDWDQRLALDCAYVAEQTFALDVKIFCVTIGKVLRGEGVNADKSTTTERFTDYTLRKQGAEDAARVQPVAAEGAAL